MVLIRIFAMIVLLYLGATSGCAENNRFEVAKRLGELALVDYCNQEKLQRTDFNEAKISPDEKYDWSIEYQSNTNPKHVLVLYVKDGRIVERHRIIE